MNSKTRSSVPTGSDRDDQGEAIAILEKLIAFDTVSSVSNLELVDYVRSYLIGHGITPKLVFNADRTKANLYATIGPQKEGGIVLSGHSDVVPPGEEPWTGSPWKLRRAQGRIYGRGACDMKGFDALALAAVPHMVVADLKYPVHLALSYDEEVGCKGVPDLADAMEADLPRPRAVIVGEPTDMQIVNGHKGSHSFFTRITGHASHSSRIDQGVSAVMIGARLVTWLEDRMRENARDADPASPFLPNYTTLHCGMFSGGTAANVVASSSEFVTDIRVIPSDDAQLYLEAYQRFIAEEILPRAHKISAQADVAIVPRSNVPGLSPQTNEAAVALAKELLPLAATGVVSYATEAGFFQAKGWPTVVVGPGNIAQAHRHDEFVSEEQFAKGQAFIRALVDTLC